MELMYKADAKQLLKAIKTAMAIVPYYKSADTWATEPMSSKGILINFGPKLITLERYNVNKSSCVIPLAVSYDCGVTVSVVLLEPKLLVTALKSLKGTIDLTLCPDTETMVIEGASYGLGNSNHWGDVAMPTNCHNTLVIRQAERVLFEALSSSQSTDVLRTAMCCYGVYAQAGELDALVATNGYVMHILTAPNYDHKRVSQEIPDVLLPANLLKGLPDGDIIIGYPTDRTEDWFGVTVTIVGVCEIVMRYPIDHYPRWQEACQDYLLPKSVGVTQDVCIQTKINDFAEAITLAGAKSEHHGTKRGASVQIYLSDNDELSVTSTERNAPEYRGLPQPVTSFPCVMSHLAKHPMVAGKTIYYSVKQWAKFFKVFLILPPIDGNMAVYIYSVKKSTSVKLTKLMGTDFEFVGIIMPNIVH